MSIRAPTIGAAVGRSLVQTLGADCAAGAALAAHFGVGMTSLARGVSLEGISAASVERAARDFEDRGWLLNDGSAWRLASTLPDGLGPFLSGAAAMHVSRSSDVDSIAVVTLPAAPSAIAAALPAEGPIHASVGRTDEAIAQIACAAVSSLTIMSPFVNREGAEFAMRMFDESVAGRRTLITRLSGTTRRALQPLLPEIISKGVRVLDYMLPAEDGYETFHAKVVIADSDLAYVGSANMTLYARHSMELGVVVKGRTARAVSALVRAVERISRRVVAP